MTKTKFPILPLISVTTFVALTLITAHAFAAPKATATQALFISVPPIQVSNYLKVGKGHQFVRTYLQVNSKQAGATVCHWMPRIRDAFFIALNSSAHEKMPHQKNLTATLEHAALYAAPKNLVTHVLVFDTRSSNDYRAEKKLKGKFSCKKKTKKAHKKR